MCFSFMFLSSFCAIDWMNCKYKLVEDCFVSNIVNPTRDSNLSQACNLSSPKSTIGIKFHEY